MQQSLLWQVCFTPAHLARTHYFMRLDNLGNINVIKHRDAKENLKRHVDKFHNPLAVGLSAARRVCEKVYRRTVATGKHERKKHEWKRHQLQDAKPKKKPKRPVHPIDLNESGTVTLCSKPLGIDNSVPLMRPSSAGIFDFMEEYEVHELEGERFFPELEGSLGVQPLPEDSIAEHRALVAERPLSSISQGLRGFTHGAVAERAEGGSKTTPTSVALTLQEDQNTCVNGWSGCIPHEGTRRSVSIADESLPWWIASNHVSPHPSRHTNLTHVNPFDVEYRPNPVYYAPSLSLRSIHWMPSCDTNNCLNNSFEQGSWEMAISASRREAVNKTLLTRSTKNQMSKSECSNDLASRSFEQGSEELVVSTSRREAVLKTLPFADLIRSGSLEDDAFCQSAFRLANTREILNKAKQPRYRYRHGRLSGSGKRRLQHVAFPPVKCDHCRRLFHGVDRRRKLGRHRRKVHESDIYDTHGKRVGTSPRKSLSGHRVCSTTRREPFSSGPIRVHSSSSAVTLALSDDLSVFDDTSWNRELSLRRPMAVSIDVFWGIGSQNGTLDIGGHVPIVTRHESLRFDNLDFGMSATHFQRSKTTTGVSSWRHGECATSICERQRPLRHRSANGSFLRSRRTLDRHKIRRNKVAEIEHSLATYGTTNRRLVGPPTQLL